MPIRMLRDFFRLESAAGLLLAFAAVFALLLTNYGMDYLYRTILAFPIRITIGDWLVIDKNVQHWVNDGLMTIFFLLVGMELKREMLEGQFSNRQQIVLPFFAAVGGVIFPSLIFYLVNYGHPDTVHGWAIPAATDIAFALGVISLLGKSVPEALKVCLVAIAIIDDLVAILIIALFYSGEINLQALVAAGACVASLALLNITNVTKVSPYMMVGVILWMCVLKSGIHATLAGVIIACFIPMRRVDGGFSSPLRDLEKGLHPWVAYGILPLFAFCNAGISLSGVTPEIFFEPLPLGIFLGLLMGKQIGVMVLAVIALSLGLCKFPEGVSWRQFYGIAVLTGIGFTMSLFIGTLAFDTPEMVDHVRLGVFAGSLVSAVAGYVILKGQDLTKGGA